MKLRHSIGIALVLLLPAHAAIAQTAKPKPADPVVGVDKVKHFFISGFIESMTFAGLQAAGSNRTSSKTGAMAVTAALSVAREIHDGRTKGLFSFRDLAWDVIGASAAMLVINKTR